LDPYWFALQGLYVKNLEGYLFLEEEAEIYSRHRREDDDGHVTWSIGWYRSAESSSRNSGLVQRLSSGEWKPGLKSPDASNLN